MLKNILFSAFIVFGMSSGIAQSKIAHLNSKEIMEAMPSYKVAVQNLEKFQEDAMNELMVMKDDFEDHIRRYQEKVATSESPTIIQLEEQKLAKKEQAILDREESIQSEIEAYSRELNLPIIEKFNKTVKIVSDRHGYDYVLDVSMVMIHNGPDITQEVIDEILKLE